MSSNPVVPYLLDQLTTAIERRDGEAAVAVLGHLRTTAGPEFTDRLLTDLISAGLRRFAQQPGGTR